MTAWDGVTDVSPAGQAAFVTQLLNQLGVSEFTLVAHDFGALVAAEIVARHPERIQTLVITNTSFWSRDWHGAPYSPFRLLRIRGIGELAFRLARPWMLRQAFRAYVARDERLTDDVMAVYWEPFEHGFAGVLLALGRDHRSTTADLRRWRHALNRYVGPVLVVWGERDPTFLANRGRSIARFIPNGRYIGIPTANHFVQEDAPEEFAAAIIHFLRGEL
jgi:pimeloyl-ACP methyl ester carboxylesterase